MREVAVPATATGGRRFNDDVKRAATASRVLRGTGTISLVYRNWNFFSNTPIASYRTQGVAYPRSEGRSHE